MAGETIVFFPKHSTLVGTTSPLTTYYSEPYDVTGYKTLTVEALLIAVAASAVVKLLFEQSSDLQTWSALGSEQTLSAGTVYSASQTSPARYVRARITVDAADGVATLWVKAVARDA